MTERLTRRRESNGGYWSDARKDQLIEKLGPYEDIGLEPEEVKALRESAREQKRAEAFWAHDTLKGTRTCSRCRKYNMLSTPYCPWCGAKMETRN